MTSRTHAWVMCSYDKKKLYQRKNICYIHKKMRTGLLVFGLVILLCVLAQCECVSALNVNPQSISLDFVFDKPKATTPFFTETAKFTITNPENTTGFTVHGVGGDIEITPSPTSGEIARGGSVTITLTIKVNSGLSEGSHSREIVVNPGNIVVPITINVVHKTQLKVSPLTIDFGSVDVDQEVKKQVKFEETLGYKSIDVTLSKTKGNDWVKPDEYSFPVSKENPKTIYFTLSKNKPGWESYKKSYSWSYSVRSDGGNYEITLRTELKLPAKLSLDRSAYEKILFDIPKSERPIFYRDVKIGLENKGYYDMVITRVYLSGFSGLDVRLTSNPSRVRGYSSSNIVLSVEAPYSTKEGSYTGTVLVDCGDAGAEDARVTIQIEHGVKLVVSPTRMDFGGVEILTEEKEQKVTLRETFGYKSVRDVTITKTSGPPWISVTPASFYGIPPEESDTASLSLLFRGETIVGKIFEWEYAVKTANAGTHKITMSAEALPPDLAAIYSDLNSIKLRPIFKHPKAKEAVSECITALDIAKAKELSGNDWGHVISVATQTTTALASMDEFTEARGEEKGTLFPKLVVATTLTQLVTGNAKSILDREIQAHAAAGSSALDGLTKEVLPDAAVYFDAVGRESEDTNCLETVKAYTSAAEAHDLLGDSQKAALYEEKTAQFSALHDELVTTANDGRVESELTITHVRSKLSELAGSAVLLNPFAYDKVSAGYDFAKYNYGAAIKKYEFAGETRMAEDSSTRLNELKKEWWFLWIAFCIYMSLLILLFSFILFRLTKGTAEFLRDSAEKRLGDVIG
jgi:hypothetical protein